MTQQSNANIQRACDLVALIVKKPRTRPELAELMGSRQCVLQPWIDGLEAEGLVKLEPAPKVPGRPGYVPKLVRWVGGEA